MPRRPIVFNILNDPEEKQVPFNLKISNYKEWFGSHLFDLNDI